MIQKFFFSAVLGVITIGLLANIYNILPGKPLSPQLLSFSNSWYVAIDTLKESPVFGIGPGNYLTAFNRFRPITYNSLPLWNVRFSNSRDFYISLVTETGLLGLAGLILLAIIVVKTVRKELAEPKIQNWELGINPKLIALITALIVIALFAPEISLIVLTFILFSVNSMGKKLTLNLSAQAPSTLGDTPLSTNFPAYIIAIPFLIASAAFAFFGTKAVSAEYTFYKSLQAFTANDGVKTYDLMQSAIRQNPYIDRYHSSFAQVNLALANSIAQSIQTQGQDQKTLTDQQRQTITQLVQQSIAEGKASVTLNPGRSDNWELLASIYRNVMAMAQGADQFAIQSYSQAVALDPINPNLRLSLGGIFYALGDFDSAIDTFKVAVIAKPDFPNARYNLAVAYREKGEYDKAITEITTVMSLLDKNSQDYQIASKELENLQSKKPVKANPENQGGQLNAPEKSAEPVVKPPINLPDNAQPPESQVTPSPSATPTATPIP